MSTLKGDFIGFSFNGYHSSDLGIVRTSDGSRFNENLLPTMQDKVVQVPGGDGSYYFGSQYTAKNFVVPFAFDSLTEKQYNTLAKVFGDKGIHGLIFDEAPYKVYSAKVTGQAIIKYICFDEPVWGKEEINDNETRPIYLGDQRIYKGEGSIQFTAYFPFAKSRFKFLDQYSVSNKKEWAEASGMASTQGTYDTLSPTGTTIPLLNPGDLETDFILKINFKQMNSRKKFLEATRINLNGQNDLGISLGYIEAKGNDYGIMINTKTNLIEGYDQNGIRTGNIYNECKESGDFFKLPPKKEISLEFSHLMTEYNPSIEYNYLYY